jgi:hypothetical protein
MNVLAVKSFLPVVPIQRERYYVIEMGKAFPICHAFIIFSLFIQDQAASSFFRRRSSVKA